MKLFQLSQTHTAWTKPFRSKVARNSSLVTITRSQGWNVSYLPPTGHCVWSGTFRRLTRFIPLDPTINTATRLSLHPRAGHSSCYVCRERKHASVLSKARLRTVMTLRKVWESVIVFGDYLIYHLLRFTLHPTPVFLKCFNNLITLKVTTIRKMNVPLSSGKKWETRISLDPIHRAVPSLCTPCVFTARSLCYWFQLYKTWPEQKWHFFKFNTWIFMTIK